MLRERCSSCGLAGTCPPEVRRDKRARRPLADSASEGLMRRAAAVLSTGWYTCYDLGVALYGRPGPGRCARMGVMVRARRPVNRLRKLGLLAVRPGARGTPEYTMQAEWPEDET